MSRPVRSVQQIDYQILHTTGRKVYKNRGDQNSSKMDELNTKVVEICSDVDDFLASYILEELTEEEEVKNYVLKLEGLKRDFRRVHSQVKTLEGTDFPTKYPYYDQRLTELTEIFKAANKKLSVLKAQSKAEEKLRESEVINSQVDKEKLRCQTERKFFIDQAQWEINDFEWDEIKDLEEIRNLISTFEARLDNFYKICSNYEVCLGTHPDLDTVRSENEKFVSSLRNHIVAGRSRFCSLKADMHRREIARLELEEAERAQIQTERSRRAAAEEDARIAGIIKCAESDFFEIRMRSERLRKRCDIRYEGLTDHEILDVKKREESFHVELREFIDKVSSFEKLIMPCRGSVKTMHDDVITMRENCISYVDQFVDNLAAVIKSRDISERKLKNSAGLKIELKKFKGYESEVDIYSFRSSFKKLVEPNVQETLWPEYLKKNYLAGAALNLVQKIDSMETIWEKLFEVYGNARLLLQNKLSSLGKIVSLEKIKKDDQKVANSIISLLNLMTDLSKLATEYGLENELYYGPALGKILDIMGKEHERKFIKSIALQDISIRQKWTKLAESLQVELKIREAWILNEKVRKCELDTEKPKTTGDGTRKKEDDASSSFHAPPTQHPPPPSRASCLLCGKSEDHIQSTDQHGKPYVEYVACKMFVEKKARERDRLLFRKRFCGKCLKPGAKYNSTHDCDTQYICGQTYTNKQGVETSCSKHVLVCGFHCGEKRNEDLLVLYKKNVIAQNKKFLDFTKNVSISCFAQSYKSEKAQESEKDHAIFAFQLIDVSGLSINLFFDGGCMEMVCSKYAADALSLLGRADHINPGPLILRGVNNQKSVCPYGEYKIRLPLGNGKEASFTGICVDDVTELFPRYPLAQVASDFRQEFGRQFDDQSCCPRLPKLPEYVGGKVDIMLGSQYLKYFPLEVGRLDSGLTLYRSVFKGSDGSTGIVAGPHPAFTEVNRASHFVLGRCYYSFQVREYLDYISDVRQVPLLGSKDSITHSDHFLDVDSHEFCDFSPGEGGVDSPDIQVYASKRAPVCLKKFEEIEKAGTVISYRCCECRKCKECLRSSRIEEISILEEAEQDLIDRSVTVDIENKCSTATLPFTADPDARLVTNRQASLKIYHSQVRRLNKSDKDLKDALLAEKKLHDLGYVDWLHNLSQEDQDAILKSPVMYFIAWLIVRSASVTTPVRPVFNASLKTSSGYSLNDILPKGTNNMNNLVEIFIRWSIKAFGYHTDVRKMYNSVVLNKKFWRFQLYWWSDNLALNEEPRIKVIKTCIYGVKSSGNQAERALRLVVEKMREQYPLAYDTVMKDVYVDDVLSGEDTDEARDEVTNELKSCLQYGGFGLKGFTFSGQEPSSDLSEDGESIKAFGVRWFSRGDFWMLYMGKFKDRDKDVDKFTLTDCASIAAQVFDPSGRTVPVTGGFKLDVSLLHRFGLKWEDGIPENFRGVWANNLEMLEELSTLRYNRVIVPPNAKNLDIITIDAGDASPSLICVAIYARFECKDGTFSCQLVFARSKVVPEGTSVPRAELMAAAINAATGFTVMKAFGSYHKDHIKLSDSMVALHWIACTTKKLKTFIRSLVIEINRLCDISRWCYVESGKMPADIGTRKGATVADINQDSDWINGLAWMRGREEDFPTLTIEEIKLNQQDMAEAEKEQIIFKVFHAQSRKIAEFDASSFEKIRERYEFSDYVIDPNRHSFRMVVRIFSFALTFIWKTGRNIPKVQNMLIFNHKSPGNLPDILKSKLDKYVSTTRTFPCSNLNTSKGGYIVTLSEEMLSASFYYFSLKASLEVRHFVGKGRYKNIAVDVEGILYYSGRILPDQQFEGYPHLSQVALDLCHSSFCVPIMDQFSPVAVSIALDIHWNHPDVRHRGIAAIYRQMLKVAHIFGGFSLASSIKHGCKRCRILNKNSVDVAMGPIQDVNLCIAPAFYASQVDIFGHYKSYSCANKRATIKVWFLIFCCCTTGGVDIRVLEDYSTDAFVQGFIRFSCRVGYPRYLLPDPGSQLVKGCEEMTYSFSDAKQKLFVEYGVDYMPCPVGAHYVHGKVERKIREVRKSVEIAAKNERLSVVQWETLMAQISNSINNLPIGLKNRVSDLEQLDLITPNRLILGRNNDRCGNAPLVICPDFKKMIETNAKIFRAWFETWLLSYVPTLVERSKWHTSGQPVNVGDIVMFLKSDREFDLQYQYGLVVDLKKNRDGLVRRVTVEYQNPNEGTKRTTERGVRDLVIISPVDELEIYERLNEIFDNCE